MPRRRLPSAPSDTGEATSPPELVRQVRTLLAEAQALSARLAALNDVAVAMQADLETEEVLQTFAREARWVLDFQVCSIALASETSYTERVLRASAGYSTDTQTRSLHEGAIARVIQRGQAQLLFTAAEDDCLPVDVQAAMLLPLRDGSTVIGTINFYARAAHVYNIDDLRIAYALAMQVAMIMHNARLLREARNTRDELNTVLESISDAVLVVDVNGCILLMNTALRQLLQLGSTHYIGQSMTALVRAMRGQERRVSQRQLLQAVRNQWRTSSGGTIKLRMAQYIEWAVVPLRANGNDEGFVITARDISERIELEQLRDATTGMLVHDLRTPLTGLILGLDMLNIYAHRAKTEDFIELLGKSKSSANRLLNLINTILDTRKMQAGHFDLERSPCNIMAMVEEALQTVMRQIENSQQHVELDLMAEAALVLIDRTIIERVLENLLSNAAKFTPPGGHICIASRLVDPNWLEVSVSDSGPGVAPEQRSMIFELYGQVSGTQPRQGTGIGLTFCKLAIEAHGGSISVRDAPERGSTFWFTIPVYHHIDT